MMMQVVAEGGSFCFNASAAPAGMNGFQFVIDSVDSHTAPFFVGATDDGTGDSAMVTMARGLTSQTKPSVVLSTFARCQQVLDGIYFLFALPEEATTTPTWNATTHIKLSFHVEWASFTIC